MSISVYTCIETRWRKEIVRGVVEGGALETIEEERSKIVRVRGGVGEGEGGGQKMCVWEVGLGRGRGGRAH